MKRNALLIGSFVIIGLALIVASVLWLSGNTLFKKHLDVMIYYKSNVTGLYVGAPVTFRGVTVGQVEEIGIQVDRDSLKALVPVRVQLSPDALRFTGSKDTPLDLQTLVQRGLRARLGHGARGNRLRCRTGKHRRSVERPRFPTIVDFDHLRLRRERANQGPQ